MERQKKQRDGRGLGLRRLSIDDFPHNNQPKQAVGMEGNMEGRCDKRKARGKCNSIVLGALEVE